MVDPAGQQFSFLQGPVYQVETLAFIKSRLFAAELLKKGRCLKSKATS